MKKEYWKLIGFVALGFGLYRLWQGYQGGRKSIAAPDAALKATLSGSRDLYLGVGAVAAVALFKAYR